MVTNRRTAVAAIIGRRDFANAAQTFSGKTVRHIDSSRELTQGKLAHEYWDRFTAAVRAGTYVTYSYDTPIAWTEKGSWVMPEVKYTLVTAQHQGIVARSVAIEWI